VQGVLQRLGRSVFSVEFIVFGRKKRDAIEKGKEGINSGIDDPFLLCLAADIRVSLDQVQDEPDKRKGPQARTAI